MIVTYDLDTQPWSVGDVIVFHQAARCLYPEYGFRFHYSGKNPENFGFVSRDHPLWSWVWGAANAFNTTCVSEGRGEWPENTSYYLYYRLWDIISGHIDELPNLEPTEKEWAENFHRENGTRGVIHVRDHPYVPNARNSRIEAWRGLVPRIEKVVQIGDVDLPGTVSARGFSVEKQIALIATSKWYMGAASGPGFVPQFFKIPNRLFSNNAPAHRHKMWDEKGFTFGNSKWFSGVETTDLLLEQYNDLT